MIPGNFPGDPFGSACVCGDFSVHRHGVFYGNVGAFCGDIVEEHLVQRIAFLLQNIFGHIYAVCAQDCNSFSSHQRIRVSRTHDHPVNARVQNRIHAGRLLSVMAARLQCYIQGRSLRIFGAGCQRIALRMSLTVSLVPALSDDPALFTTTAPTIGLGDVHPQPFFASCKARRIYSLSFIVSPPKEKALNKNVQGKPKRHKGPVCKSSRMQTHPRAASTSAEPCGLCVWYLLSSRLYCRLRSFTESCLTARGLYHR